MTGEGEKTHEIALASKSLRPSACHGTETADQIFIQFYIWDPLLKSAEDNGLLTGRPVLVFWACFRLSCHVAGWLNNDGVRNVCSGG